MLFGRQTGKMSPLKLQSYDRSTQFLQGHDDRFERMLDTLQTLPIPRVDAEQVRRWFGEVKKFPKH